VSPVDPSLKIAVFDGGITRGHEFGPLVNEFSTQNLGAPVPQFEQHGAWVTSAALFGSIDAATGAARPIAVVDNYRVLDVDTGRDPQGELFDVLERVVDVLEKKPYEFVNLSIGPDLPIEDDDVHVWTAKLDSILSSGRTLATVAVGNNGEADRASGNARIQTPADCVNALGIGAATSQTSTWARAPYSCFGPGRSPGVVKPDVVSFGGEGAEPFFVFKGEGSGELQGMSGTSFASPSALRAAAAVRAYLGPVIRPVTLKALLVHQCDKTSADRSEVGWGRVPTELASLITSPDTTAHIIYQGELEPAKYLRAEIPTADGMRGKVTISATFCFAAETDPQDPIHYTRAGLEITFRPNQKARKKPTQIYADTMSFFQAKDLYSTESELREDAHKWETTLHATKVIEASKLDKPVFDIHYNSRSRGRASTRSKNIPYALIVTVDAPEVPDLYDGVVRRYRSILEALTPTIQIPIRTS
jgi:hypothetical protein